MVLATEIHDIHIGTTIVGPVVRQSDDELEAFLSGQLDDFVEALQAVISIV